MNELTIGRWRVEADTLATAAAYSQVKAGGADACTCGDCQYYRAHRENIMPGRLREILQSLGIDYRREAETTCVDLRNGQVLYRGWFHFIGRVLDGADAWKGVSDKSATADFEDLDGFEFGLTSRVALAPPAFPRDKLVQVEFSVTVAR